uniref:Uncharacterized protein n=1 Tax=Rhizophora mucronata TaxID=61149 RepID=A0A2P2QS21_RHIMU
MNIFPSFHSIMN